MVNRRPSRRKAAGLLNSLGDKISTITNVKSLPNNSLPKVQLLDIKYAKNITCSNMDEILRKTEQFRTKDTDNISCSNTILDFFNEECEKLDYEPDEPELNNRSEVQNHSLYNGHKNIESSGNHFEKASVKLCDKNIKISVSSSQIEPILKNNNSNVSQFKPVCSSPCFSVNNSSLSTFRTSSELVSYFHQEIPNNYRILKLKRFIKKKRKSKLTKFIGINPIKITSYDSIFNLRNIGLDVFKMCENSSSDMHSLFSEDIQLDTMRIEESDTSEPFHGDFNDDQVFEGNEPNPSLLSIQIPDLSRICSPCHQENSVIIHGNAQIVPPKINNNTTTLNSNEICRNSIDPVQDILENICNNSCNSFSLLNVMKGLSREQQFQLYEIAKQKLVWFKTFFSCFTRLNSTLNDNYAKLTDMINDVLSVFKDASDQKIYVWKIIEALQNTGLDFKESVERIILRHGTSQTSICDILFSILTENMDKIETNWDLIRKLTFCRFEKLDTVIVARMLRYALTRKNFILVEKINRDIVYKNLVDLTKIPYNLIEPLSMSNGTDGFCKFDQRNAATYSPKKKTLGGIKISQHEILHRENSSTPCNLIAHPAKQIRLNPSYSCNISLHNLYPINPAHTCQIDNSDILVIKNALETTNAAHFLKLAQKYSDQTVLEVFIVNLFVLFKKMSTRIILNRMKTLLDGIDEIEPNWKNIRYLTVVFEVLILNLIYFFQLCGQMENARELLMYSKDWHSLLTSKIFVNNSTSHMLRYINIVRILILAKDIYTANEFLQCKSLSLVGDTSKWPYQWHHKDIKSRNDMISLFLEHGCEINIISVNDFMKHVVVVLDGNVRNFEIWTKWDEVLINLLNGENERKPTLRLILDDIINFYWKFINVDILQTLLFYFENDLTWNRMLDLFKHCVKRGVYKITGYENNIVIPTNFTDLELKLIFEHYHQNGGLNSQNFSLKFNEHTTRNTPLKLLQNSISNNRDFISICLSIQNILKNYKLCLNFDTSSLMRITKYTIGYQNSI